MTYWPWSSWSRLACGWARSTLVPLFLRAAERNLYWSVGPTCRTVMYWKRGTKKRAVMHFILLSDMKHICKNLCVFNYWRVLVVDDHVYDGVHLFCELGRVGRQFLGRRAAPSLFDLVLPPPDQSQSPGCLVDQLFRFFKLLSSSITSDTPFWMAWDWRKDTETVHEQYCIWQK